MKYTRDEIMAMDAEQLRLAIAEAKGCSDFYDHYIFDGASGRLHAKLTIGERTADVNVPDWPNDISAAWELVEEMRELGMWVAVDSTNNGWVCFAGSQSNDTEYWCSCDNHNEGDEPPMAISRAWLMWKEGV